LPIGNLPDPEGPGSTASQELPALCDWGRIALILARAAWFSGLLGIIVVN
jgi:hypothetical protein